MANLDPFLKEKEEEEEEESPLVDGSFAPTIRPASETPKMKTMLEAVENEAKDRKERFQKKAERTEKESGINLTRALIQAKGEREIREKLSKNAPHLAERGLAMITGGLTGAALGTFKRQRAVEEDTKQALIRYRELMKLGDAARTAKQKSLTASLPVSQLDRAAEVAITLSQPSTEAVATDGELDLLQPENFIDLNSKNPKKRAIAQRNLSGAAATLKGIQARAKKMEEKLILFGERETVVGVDGPKLSEEAMAFDPENITARGNTPTKAQIWSWRAIREGCENAINPLRKKAIEGQADNMPEALVAMTNRFKMVEGMPQEEATAKARNTWDKEKQFFTSPNSVRDFKEVNKLLGQWKTLTGVQYAPTSGWGERNEWNRGNLEADIAKVTANISKRGSLSEFFMKKDAAEIDDFKTNVSKEAVAPYGGYDTYIEKVTLDKDSKVVPYDPEKHKGNAKWDRIKDESRFDILREVSEEIWTSEGNVRTSRATPLIQSQFEKGVEPPVAGPEFLKEFLSDNPDLQPDVDTLQAPTGVFPSSGENISGFIVIRDKVLEPEFKRIPFSYRRKVYNLLDSLPVPESEKDEGKAIRLLILHKEGNMKDFNAALEIIKRKGYDPKD